MFYEGDLQSGISQALQESKLVACFVTDNGDESQMWESDFLEDLSIKSSLLEKTILLRLTAGSQEAGYLAAIFPLPKTPTLVLIENGQLKDYITTGVSKEEFLRRISVIFEFRSGTPMPQSLHESTEITSNAPTTSNHGRQPAQVIETPVPAADDSSSRVVQDLLSERSARLQAHKKEQEAREKAKRIAEAKTRKAALEEESPAGSQRSANQKYALMQKKRQQDAREERARILKRVEDDKIERREKDAQRKAQAIANNSQSVEPVAASSSIVSSADSRSKECALQIRLFDGSTIRSRFSTQGTLRADVRPWIDQQQSADVPYTFKHILTPQPNKSISISGEEKTLQSQGLFPSATLVLVPIQGYTSAYNETNATGYISRGMSAGYGMISSGVGVVTGALGGLLGTRAAPSSSSADVPVTNAQSSNINVTTLRDQDGPEDHQFYNGNALNFEPRKDDDGKKDE